MWHVQVLNARLNMGGPGGASYYRFTPHPAWQIVVLDGYDVSLLGWPQDHPLHQQACRILDERNPNQVYMHPVKFYGNMRAFVAICCVLSALCLHDCLAFSCTTKFNAGGRKRCE